LEQAADREVVATLVMLVRPDVMFERTASAKRRREECVA
jgi:hypothetical protein